MMIRSCSVCALGAHTRLIGLLGLVALAALVAALPLPSPPAAASEKTALSAPQAHLAGTSPAPLHALTDTVKLTATLGTTTTFSITITNPSTATTITPLLYEAQPVPPAGVAPQSNSFAVPQRVALPEQEPRLDPQIMRDMAEAPDRRAGFLVFLHAQPDLSPAYHISPWDERGRFVYEILFNNARLSQRNLRLWLDEQEVAYRPLWIVNAIEVKAGSPAVLQALEARTDVALLRANHVVNLGRERLAATSTNCQPDDHGICWNIRSVGADRVWYTFGVSGQGITVASIDSGVFASHQALIEQYRGYEGSGVEPRHSYNWFDAHSGTNTPTDAGEHGTHTMGTMVGRGDGSDNQPAVGVAPGATWIAARGCDSQVCKDADLFAAAQWLLAPTDETNANPRPDMRPHIINNSWASAEGNDDFYHGFVTAWRAAGIFPVFAAGNDIAGVTCGSIVSPGDYSEVLTAGSVTQYNDLSSFSRVGPTHDGRIKPDLTAPGSSIASTTSTGNLAYRNMSGTSMAAPHVAGAVALLWAANPTLIGNYEETYALLTQNAAPRTEEAYDAPPFATCPARSVPNNIFGYGTLDTYQAVEQAKVDLPWLDLPAVPADPMLPASSRGITLTIDARQVYEPGTYEGRVLVSTGDLSDPLRTISVLLTVVPPEVHATVSGTVRDEEGEPIGDSVIAIDISNGTKLRLGTTSTYSVTLPANYDQPTIYTFTARATGYVTRHTTLTLTHSTHITRDIEMLRDKPRLQLGTEPLSVTLAYGESLSPTLMVQNTGTQSLEYSASSPIYRFSVQRSDEPDGPTPAWVEPPAGAVFLTLEDDSFSEAVDLGFAFPFASHTYHSVQIGSNGLLVFEDLQSAEGFIPWCESPFPELHLPETSGAAILPLRIDLNPEQGGNIWYGWLHETGAETAEGEDTEQRFVVSYENVSLYDQPANTFTFQVLLTASGNVQFNYQQVGELSIYAANGLQLMQDEWQLLGCSTTTPITSGLTINLRPQPATDLWLTLPPSTSTALPPGETTAITMGLNWVSPFEAQPYQGTVTLHTNDPQNAVVQRSIHLYTRPNRQFITFSGSEGATLPIMTSSGEALAIHIPEGTFAQTTTLEYLEAPPPTDIPDNYGFADHAFIVRAYQNGALLPRLALSPPLSVTLTYDDTNLEEKEENSLMLYYKDTSELVALHENWHRLPSSPGTPILRDMDSNRLTFGLPHLGKFALFYPQDIHAVYLPLVSHSGQP